MCLIKHHNMQMYGGMQESLHTCLTSALDGGEWSARVALLPVNRRLGGFQHHHRYRDEEKNFLALLGIEPSFLSCLTVLIMYPLVTITLHQL
jgi:hypothetical protein